MLRTVLEEQNINTSGMNKADMIKVLENMHDFKVQNTRGEELHGHRYIFLPKYHCELNPIERVWGPAKQFRPPEIRTVLCSRRVVTVPNDLLGTCSDLNP